MNNRDWGIYLIPFLAALAIFLPLTSGTKPPATISTTAASQEKAEPSKTKKPTKLKGGAAALLAQFLGTDPSAPKNLKNYQLEFLIATVPDPIDSSLGYMFDRHVAAIQNAAQTSNYLLDRSDLPWTDKQGQDKKEEEKLEGRRYQREPGVILFRGAAKLLFVFLVGETPTSGIHKDALLSAFEQVRKMCALTKEPQCREFRLMAPTFSGSLDSLRIAIETWRKGNTESQFKIVSGSATALDPKQLTFGKDRFTATVAPDNDVVDSFLHYLREIGVEDREIAILKETSTPYGQAASTKEGILFLTYPLRISQLRGAAEKARQSEKGAISEAPSLRTKNLPPSLEEGNDPKVLLPPFFTFDTFSAELVLSDVLSTISREHIRYLGLFSTDVKDQIFLARKIRELAPNVVLFTFGADLIYLHSDTNLEFQGMLLVSTYPLFNRNQLWVYSFNGATSRLQFPSDTAQGVYNATLALLGNQPNMLEYGRPFDEGQDSTKARKPALWLSAVGKNDLWPIRLLDRKSQDLNRYLYDSGVPAKDKGTSKVDLSGRLYSQRIVFILGSLLLLCAVPAMLLCAEFLPTFLREKLPGWVRESLNKANGLRIVFGDAVFPPNSFERRLYLLALALTILTLNLVVVRILARLLACRLSTDFCDFGLVPNDVGLFNWLTFGFLAMLGSVLVVPLGLKLAFSLTDDFARASNRARLGISVTVLSVILGPLVVLFLAGKYGFDISNLSDKTSQLFLYLRMLDTGNGLSPLLPLFFAGVGGFLWIGCSLRRLRLLEELGTANSNEGLFLYAKADSLVGIDHERLEHKIRQLLERPHRVFMWVVVLVFVGLPGLVLFQIRLVGSFEGIHFYRFFGWSFLLIYLALAFAFVRLQWVWWETKKLLRYLSWHPAHNAFKTLPEKCPQMPRLDLSNPVAAFATLELSVDQARAMLKQLGQQFPAGLFDKTKPRGDVRTRIEALEHHVSKADDSLRKGLKADSVGDWEAAMRERADARSALSEVSKSVVGMLAPAWKPEQTAPLGEKEREWVQLGESFLAGRAVDFLNYVFSHLRNLLVCVTAGLLLMLLAVTSYPFQPREWLLWFNWSIILTTVFLTMVVFVQMGRDRILSDLSGTKPGEVTWNRDFILRTLLHGLVPILVLLSAQFPEGLKRAFSWLSFSQGGP
jgi:uncharacterized membrane protein